MFPRYRLCLRHGLELAIPNRSEAPGGNLAEIETLASLRLFARLRRRRYEKRERKREKESSSFYFSTLIAQSENLFFYVS